ncbi:hypothetical protein [Schleiferilactobacillus shenzhenensis]|uniref:Uncharacterized protein n=1 Tax=Schleiferilactobacillus shenzhenensis LY-73 TaxID=1231336 RepID=U4TVP4_9LACO|nr:hypothetical protein [Schleiferilactobacillus shenzhenensis]ERL65472.1 hypothetical protein L248_2545 [Schleiferilactobacillus shenzhenensis LY-73]
MTYDTWVFAERFVNTWLPVGLVGGLLLLTGGLLAYFHKGRARRWGAGAAGIGVVMLAVFMIITYQPTTQTYMKEFGHVTPRIRVEEPTFFGYTATSTQLTGIYSKVRNDDDMKQLPMYTRTAYTQKVRYAGDANGSYYFYLGSLVAPINYMGPVEERDVAQPYLRGYRYTLKDPQYKRIGFINPENATTIALVVPKTLKHRAPSADVLGNNKRLARVDSGWTTEEK